MKFQILSIILIFFLGLLTLSVLAQNEENPVFLNQKVPKSDRSDVVSLSRYLTKDFSNDSMKVVSIASWIVRNISYDYKTLKSGDWKKRSTKKILKKRKALCGGFSELFNELCFEAGIRSETVIGYTKSWNYEPYDSLIRAEHAWNIVKIDGKWVPIDLSWSTGYFVRKKQKCRKKLYLWFNIPYTIKYKFINELTYKYMFASPNQFIKSHLPLQPYFQLLRTPVPLKVFEKDSTNHYLNSADEKFEMNFDYEISRYNGLSEKDKHLKGAIQAHEFNKQNHRILGIGYYNYTTELQNEIDPKLPEENQIESLDSCLVLYKTSKEMYGEYARDTKREYKRRRDRNNGFKKYLLDENRDYISKFKNNYKNHKKTHYRTIVNINKSNSLSRKYKRKLNKVSPNGLKKIKRPLKENGVKIAKSKVLIFSLDSLENLNQANLKFSLENMYQNINKQILTKEELHKELLKGYEYSREICKIIYPYRYNYSEYNKSWIDSVKDVIGHSYEWNKEINGSILQAYDSLIALNDSIANFYNFRFTDNYQQQLKKLKNLKRLNINDMAEDSSYYKVSMDLIANYQFMVEVYDTISQINKLRQSELKDYILWNKKIVKQLKREIRLEYKRFHLMNRHYRKWYIFYKNQAARLKKEVTNREFLVKQEIRYLKEQIKIRDAKLKSQK
jgi:hypothetical protein